MKLSIALSIFVLFLGTCIATDIVYDRLASSDYSNHPLIPGLRETGLNYVVRAAYNNGDITTKDFTLTKTNSIEFRRASGTSGNKFYKYNCSLVNDHNQNETLTAQFVMRYNCATEEQAVVSWKYKFEIHSWIEIPLCPACSEPKPEPQPEPQPEPEPETQPEPVEEEEEEEIIVEVPEEEEAIEEEEIIVEVPEEEEAAEEVAEEEEIIEEQEDAEDLEPVEQEEAQQEEATVPAPEPPKESTNSTQTDTIVYPWILLPKDTYTSLFHEDNAQYGTNYLLNQEIARGNLSAGTWSIGSLDFVYQQTLPNITNYRYHIIADRAEDTWIYNFTFGLKFTQKTGFRSMGFYRFQTLDANGKNIGVGTLPDLAPLKNATQNVTTTIVDGQTVGSNKGEIVTSA